VPPPESQEEAPRWPLWFPLAAAAVGLPAWILISAVVTSAAGIDEDSPWSVVVVNVLFQICLAAGAVLVAGSTGSLRLSHFGIRPAPVGRAIGMLAAAAGAFYAFSAIYGAAVRPDNPQTLVEDVGANESATLLVLGGLMVIVVAPVCEELFFRGMLFRVLRNRLPFWPAAAIVGAIFGLVHGALIIAPVLAFLGGALCWLYERTGSLLPAIALHVINNTVTYAVLAEDGVVVAAAFGTAMLVACAAALTPRPARQAR
jgi:membrane protease YdiL (CAAX protease family)